MITKFRFLLFLATLIAITNCDSNSSNEPSATDSDNFEFILYDNLDECIIPPILEKLEANYPRVLNDLQVSSISKVRVKIWAHSSTFEDAMENDIGTRFTGATGYVYGIDEIRVLNAGNAAQIALHEFAHVVTMHVNASIPNNPRWLWEAVAIYEAQEFVHPSGLPYMANGEYPSIDELNTAYNKSSHKIYSVGFILLEYIMKEWGMEKVIELINANGNVKSTLGITISEFEHNWHEYIKQEYF